MISRTRVHRAVLTSRIRITYTSTTTPTTPDTTITSQTTANPTTSELTPPDSNPIGDRHLYTAAANEEGIESE